ncbi:hypothetical protein [uncultured Legionella sp.]|uniref:hypothetical protein n=1 Tax=uncultured Legionella sp. TaxID=210934 RepID=UPI0026371723|nr:hypothetical protein [uncultured Legionella sp.]
MSKNALFNLIKIIKTTAKLGLPDNIQLIERTHKLGSKYFLFELPPEKNYFIGQYRLISHHLSVYEKPLGKIDLKSQYHYTAYFAHQGDTYRLHTYFGVKDNYVSKPLFSKIISDDEFSPVDCSEHEAAFDLLADSAIDDLISCLRATQNTHIKMFTEQAEELERQLLILSHDMYKNKAKYLATLKTQIDVLRDLVRYSTEPRAITQKIKWLTTTLGHIELMTVPENRTSNTLPKPVSKGKAEVSDKDSSKKHGAHQVTHFKKPHSAAKPAASEKINFSLLIDKLSQKYDACVNLKDDILTTRIPSLYSELNEAEWDLESTHRYHVTFNDLEQLKALKSKVEVMGLKLLQRTLFTGDFNEAAKLGMFYALMPTSIVGMALHRNNSSLLDFLLKNKIIPIDFKKFTVADVMYASMVEYCFKTTTEEKSKEELLGVLIKNGATLLDVDRSSGLPYAALLLLKSKHPLHAVLDRNAKATLNNPMFYKQLNQVLHVIATKSGTSIELQAQARELVSTNQTRIELLKHHITPIENNTLSQELEDTLGDEMMRQIIEDPEIQFYKLKIERQILTLLPQIPVQQRKNFANIANFNFQLVRNAVNQIQNFDEVPSFDEIKCETLKQQRHILEFIGLREELVGVQNKLRTVHHKPSREQKKMVARGKEILQRMEEIEAFLTKPYASIIKTQELVTDIMSAMNKFVSMAKQLNESVNEKKLSAPDEELLTEKLGQLFLRAIIDKATESDDAATSANSLDADDDDSDESVSISACKMQ